MESCFEFRKEPGLCIHGKLQISLTKEMEF